MPTALAVLAAVLVGIYIVSYRNSVNERRRPGEGPRRFARHPGRHRRGRASPRGGYLQSRPSRAARRAGSVASAAPLTSLVAGPIYKGEQITLRQFKPLAQAGIFAKFSGKQRAVAVPGDPSQLLAGHARTATASMSSRPSSTTVGGSARATSRVILQNLLVLKAPDADKAKRLRTARRSAATLVHDRSPGADDGLGDEERAPGSSRCGRPTHPARQHAEPRDAPVGPRAAACRPTRRDARSPATSRRAVNAP